MAKLDDRLAALAAMPPATLRDEWQRLYGSSSPRLSPDLLRLGLGYRLQEMAGKGVSASLLKRLGPQADASAKPPPVIIRPGTQLIRSWHGRMISVAVEDGGFLFEGRRYTSLTAIAREVTGAAWSGPRFFGMTARQAHGQIG